MTWYSDIPWCSGDADKPGEIGSHVLRCWSHRQSHPGRTAACQSGTLILNCIWERNIWTPTHLVFVTAAVYKHYSTWLKQLHQLYLIVHFISIRFYFSFLEVLFASFSKYLGLFVVCSLFILFVFLNPSFNSFYGLSLCSVLCLMTLISKSLQLHCAVCCLPWCLLMVLFPLWVFVGFDCGPFKLIVENSSRRRLKMGTTRDYSYLLLPGV